MQDNRDSGAAGELITDGFAARDFFHSILDRIDDDILVVTTDRRVRFANRAFIDKIRRPADEVLQETCHELLYGCDDRKCQGLENCLVEGVLRLGKSSHASHLFPTSDGSMADEEVAAYPMTDSSGKIVDILMMHRKVTEARLLEEKVEQLTQAERRRAQEALALARVAKATSATLDATAILRTIGEHTAELFQAENCVILLLDEDGRTLSPSFSIPSRSRDEALSVRIPVADDRIWQFILERRTVIAIDNVSTRPARAKGSSAETKSILVAPLVAKDRQMGILYLDFASREHAWTDEEKALAAALSDQAALAIDNARMYTTATEKAAKLQAINEVAQAINSSLNLDEILRSITEHMRKIIGFDRASISLIDGNGVSVRTFAVSHPAHSTALPETNGPLDKTSPGWVIANRKPWIDSDLTKELRFFEDSRLVAEGIRSRIVLPLLAKSAALGTLNLGSKRPGAYSERDLEILSPITGFIASAIENANLFKSATKRTLELTALHSIASTISRSLDLNLILKSVVDNARQILNSDVSFLCLASSPEGDLRVVMEAGGSTKKLLGMTVKTGDHLGTLRAPSIMNGTERLAQTDPHVAQIIEEEGLISVLTVPMLTDGNLLGLLHVANRQKTYFSEGDVMLLSTFADQAAIAIRNARLHEELKQLAITDGLTTLYNHRYFYHKLSEEFDRARRFERPLSLIFIDIDDLKVVNDRHGHLKGDAVLRELSRLIKSAARSTDTVARYGGDEFTIILPETSGDQAVALAQRLLEKVLAHRFVHSGNLPVTISVGVVSLNDGVSRAVDLVSRADKAAYRAKTVGKARLCVYDEIEPTISTGVG